MKLRQFVVHVFILALALTPAFPQQPARAAEAQAAPKTPRPLDFKDALGWKRVSSPTISNDGQWFAHKLVPNEGDSEIVLRRIKDGKEWRFPTGESQGFGGGPIGGGFLAASDVAFSDDGKWFAFTVSPTFKEGKRLKKERKPSQNKLTIIELATEKKVEIEKVRRFAFSGENSAWLALHKYGADAGPAMPPAALAAGAGAAPGGATPPERATGSDLILRELAAGNELNVGNVADFAFDKKGAWLAWTIDANEKSGNGIQVRNMSNGAVLPLDSDKAVYRGLNWTEKGEGLVAVKGVEDKGFEDKLYSVVAFNFTSGTPNN